jgi:endogenous inhibitor of DNA gyrase (YacG/DUF329 family)
MPLLELEVKGRWLWIVIGANLVVLLALAFVYPHLMVGPGALEPGHAELATDCFACHTPLRGATADRCEACHKLPDIGLRSTRGAVVVKARPVKLSFHQELSDTNCMACHSDHAGPKLTQRSRKPFSHAMLRTATRSRCDSCHAAPTNGLHRALNVSCDKCHKTAAWKPAGFDHAVLGPAERGRCESCHKAPADRLHQQITGNCASCHQPSAWKPATFDHDKFFPLGKDHNASCITCHAGNDYRKYTCYGCHEHTPANMLAKHREEGIGEDLAQCVRCHRNASGEGEGRSGGEGGRGGREKD